MSYDNIWLPRKGVKAAKPDSGGAIVKTVPVFGVVKDNIDPTRSGRLRVYISGLNGKDPDDARNWTPVMYLPPFYGWIPGTSPKDGPGTFRTNPSSYGLWNSPPDIGTTVICVFVNGDPNYGFYIGCVPEPDALQMIPAIGATTNVVPNEGQAASFGGATRLPVTNINNNNSDADSPNFLTAPKPVHSYSADIMFQQGILRDPIRGPITSSANRETPSRVGWGVSTPGRPIYEGNQTEEQIATIAKEGKQVPGLKIVSRKGGHSIVMDDGDLAGNDQLIRLRTALGHQILMSDNGQTLMILHSNGQSYIELGKEGTIDMYSTNSVNIRTQGDLNLHADNNININAAKKLNIQADEINISSETNYNLKVSKNSSLHTMGTHTHKVDGPMSMGSQGEASYASSSVTYINGSRVNLNTGATSTVPETVPAIPVIAHTDTLYDSTKGFAAAPGKLLSIASRAPAHAPWASAGQGVNVKTSTNASSQLPKSPSTAIAAINNTASSAPGNLVSAAGAATVPPVNPVSSALDKNTTSAMVSAVAQAAAQGPAAAAVAAGAGVVQTATGAVAAVGTTALTPQQLENAKIIKPGASVLVNSLISNGANVATAMTTNLFMGKAGAETLQKLIQNPAAQAGATVENLQRAQTALTNAGAITGKEAPGAIAGVVMSGSQNGVSNTLNAIKTVANNVTGAVTGLVSGATNAVTGAVNGIANSIKAGNFAAGLSQNVMGGLGAISGAVGSLSKITGVSGLLDAAKGAAGSAFGAITKAFKPLQANVPQDLAAIATKNATELATAEAASAAGAAAATGILGNATAQVAAAATEVAELKNKATASISSASAVASGVDVLPSGQNAVSTITNNALGALNAVPGTLAISGLIKNTSTAALNGMSISAAQSSAISSVTGAVAGVAASAQNLASTNIRDLQSNLGKNSLSSLASTGLPAGAQARLNSAMTSLTSMGSIPIKLPDVGLNTTDRSELAATSASILGGLESPNFSGQVSTKSKTAQDAILEKMRAKVDKTKELSAKYDVQSAVVNQKIKAYNDAKNSLPEGDPKIEELRQDSLTELKKLNQIGDEIRQNA